MPPEYERNPLRAVGAVTRRRSSDKSAFLGTGFVARQEHAFLTAAHCIGDLKPDELLVECPEIPRVVPVKAVDLHPTADLALLTLDLVEGSGMRALWGLTTHDGRFDFASVGVDFFAYGFPESTMFGDDPPMPTARLFKGHIQRYLDHATPGGRYRYIAGELSIPAPAGLSGGPLLSDAGSYAYGLVTENLESYTTLDEVEQLRLGEKVVATTRYRRVITYGLALMFGEKGVAEWLNARIPPHPIHEGTPGWL